MWHRSRRAHARAIRYAAAPRVTSRPALVIARDPGRRDQLAACLTQAGLPADVAAVRPASVAGRLVVCALDDGAPPPALDDAARVVVIVPHAGLAEVAALLAPAPVAHVLVGDDAATAPALATTARKLATGDIFGLEHYLPGEVSIERLRLDDFAGRGQAIEAVARAAEQAQLRRQVRGAIAQACEELLMNALYDAPVDAAGKPLFADVEPHERVRARSPRPVTLRFAATAERFTVAVRDRYGLLAKNTVVSYLAKCLGAPSGDHLPGEQIDRKIAGAGLGLYLVASTAARLVINVAHGVATEVICQFDRAGKAPLRELGLFLHHPTGATSFDGPTPATANPRPGTEPPVTPRPAGLGALVGGKERGHG